MAKSHLITFQDDNYIEPQSGEGVDRITLGRETKGGSGSGNFGHAGRPGQVGGSAEDAGLTGEIAKPLFNAKKMKVRDAAWHRNFVRDTLDNMTRYPEETSYASSNLSSRELRQLIIHGFKEHANSAAAAGHPKLSNAFNATSVVLGYKNASSDAAAKKAMAIMQQQLDAFLATKKRRY